jgi:hypothetical protein
MPWTNQMTVRFRASNDPDPMEEGYVEQDVAFTWFIPDFIDDADGGETEYGDTEIVDGKAIRWVFACDCVEFSNEATASDDELQDLGVYYRLKSLFYGEYDYVWIWRVYESGDDPTTPRRRADERASNEDGVDSFWHLSDDTTLGDDEDYPYDPPGRLPWRVKRDGDIKAEKGEGGVMECSFMLKASFAEVA